MSYAPMTDALRAQLIARYPSGRWDDPRYGINANRQREDSPRTYMTVEEGISHFHHWSNQDRRWARAVAEYTEVEVAYTIPSGAYVAFLDGITAPIRFTASLGLLTGGKRGAWWEDPQTLEILPGGVERVELTHYRGETERGSVSTAPHRVCSVCYIVLPLGVQDDRHEECA
jgi:hypothetical protein